MEPTRPNRYGIKIAEGKCRCIQANGQQGKGFVSSDVIDKLPKLYVVKRDCEIYYVGITQQDIRKRLRIGFSARGEHGYHGYKWKELDEAEMIVWTFPTSPIEEVEAIEAELVYFIREKTGRWPKYQMEIHFHGASDSQVQAAESILREILSE